MCGDGTPQQRSNSDQLLFLSFSYHETTIRQSHPIQKTDRSGLRCSNCYSCSKGLAQRCWLWLFVGTEMLSAHKKMGPLIIPFWVKKNTWNDTLWKGVIACIEVLLCPNSIIKTIQINWNKVNASNHVAFQGAYLDQVSPWHWYTDFIWIIILSHHAKRR